MTAGDIFHAYFSSITNPKYKFLVLARTDGIGLGFFINTKVPNLYSQPHLNWALDCQVIIPQSMHDFLEYDSFIDCAFTQRVDVETFEQHIKNGHAQEKGCAHIDIILEIIKAVNISKGISKREKELIFIELSTLYRINIEELLS